MDIYTSACTYTRVCTRNIILKTLWLLQAFTGKYLKVWRLLRTCFRQHQLICPQMLQECVECFISLWFLKAVDWLILLSASDCIILLFDSAASLLSLEDFPSTRLVEPKTNLCNLCTKELYQKENKCKIANSMVAVLILGITSLEDTKALIFIISHYRDARVCLL